MTEQVRKRLIFQGRVQGVGFRAFLRQLATNHQVTGWVKNRVDGRVEAVLEGEKENIKEVILKAKEGPRWARVEEFEVFDETYKGDFDGFYIK